MPTIRECLQAIIDRNSTVTTDAAKRLLVAAREHGVLDVELSRRCTTTGASPPFSRANGATVGEWEGAEEWAAERYNMFLDELVAVAGIWHVGGGEYYQQYRPERPEGWEQWVEAVEEEFESFEASYFGDFCTDPDIMAEWEEELRNRRMDELQRMADSAEGISAELLHTALFGGSWNNNAVVGFTTLEEYERGLGDDVTTETLIEMMREFVAITPLLIFDDRDNLMAVVNASDLATYDEDATRDDGMVVRGRIFEVWSLQTSDEAFVEAAQSAQTARAETMAKWND